MKKGEIVDFEITDLVFGGRGLVHVKHEDNDNFVVFVGGALPGQKVKAMITKKKKRFAEAKTLEVLEKSKIEVENDYQSVPGAPWATLPIEVQGEYKKKQVFDLFSKFAKVELDKVFDEFIESPEIWNYRNKMEFSFGYSDEDFELDAEEKKVWRHFGFALGSKKRGQYWLVENAEKPSGIFDEEFENFLSEIRKFCEETKLQPWNPKKNEGFFRQLAVRKSFLQNKFLINLVTSSVGKEQFVIDDFVKLLTDKFGEKIGGILWTITDSVSDGGGMSGTRDLFFGEDVLIEKINGLEFEVSMDSFFQTNVFSAEKLYEKAAEYVFHESKGDLNVWDLFCGTGTISQVLSKKMAEKQLDGQILGVEIVASAVNDANANAARNKLENVEFLAEDVNVFLKKHEGEHPPIIVLDPPRAGIAPKALKKIVEFGPEKIVYISCNPATMARDTEILSEKYKLEKLSIVDQFPHTNHIECVGGYNLKTT